uniref:Uncharacterized protein n=1 Tax=Tetraodon nigroviridis TaxID=99883 RepID=H3DI31_TETNG
MSKLSLEEALPDLTHGPDKDTVMDVLTSLFCHILTEPAIMRHLTPSAFKFGPPQHQDPALSYSSMSLYPTSQRLTVQGGKISGQQQEHSMVGKEGAAE